MNFPGPVFMPVECPSCGSVAQIKSTKTSHLMLRCDSCGVLIFANGPLSQAWLMNLPELGSNWPLLSIDLTYRYDLLSNHFQIEDDISLICFYDL